MKEVINIRAMSPGSVEEFSLDAETDWVAEILTEFNEDCIDISLIDDNFYLKISGKIQKKDDSHYSNVLLFDAEIQMKFATTCVLTGKPMVDYYNGTLSTIYIDSKMAQKYEIEDEISLLFGTEERELYLYKKGNASLKEVVREHLFLEKNPYPKLESEVQ